MSLQELSRTRRFPGFVPSLIGFIALTVFASSCVDSGGTTSPPTQEPILASVIISPSTDTLASLGDTTTLRASVADTDGNVIAGITIEWTSSDTTVAIVSGSGTVTSVANGIAEITATAGGVFGTAAITVKQVAAALSVSPSSDTLTSLGAETTLDASVSDANGFKLTGITTAWSSSDTTVAIVSDSGVVTSVANGIAEIAATAGGIADTAIITVNQVAVALSVTPSSDT